MRVSASQSMRAGREIVEDNLTAKQAPSQGTEGLAIASLVLGILASFTGLTAIRAIVCGHIARRCSQAPTDFGCQIAAKSFDRDRPIGAAWSAVAADADYVSRVVRLSLPPSERESPSRG